MRTRKVNKSGTSMAAAPPKKGAVKVPQKPTPKPQQPPPIPVAEQVALSATSVQNPPNGGEDVPKSKPLAGAAQDERRPGEVLDENAVSEKENAKPSVSDGAAAGSGAVAVPMEEDKNATENPREEAEVSVSDAKGGAPVDVVPKEGDIEVHVNGGRQTAKDSSEKEDQTGSLTTAEGGGTPADNDGDADIAKDGAEWDQKKGDRENDTAEEYTEAQRVLSASERQKRRKLEVFVGGLDKEATEEDLRKAFEKAGDIAEIRLMKNFQTGKNKGYAFVRFTTAAEAKRAVKELSNTQIRGKQCGVVPLEENDTIFLGNIDKNWTKDDISEKLKEVGIENIENVTVIDDPHNVGLNRGFAFLELDTYKDAQIAYKKLQNKDVFGKGQAIKVAWAQPFNDPDEDVMAQVKSVFVDGVPQSWNEEQIKEHFGKFGEIERVVLAQKMQSAKRKDFGFVNYTTREAAIACIEALSKADELTDGDSKVKIKVSLAKPLQKGKTGKGDSKGKSKGDSRAANKGGSQAKGADGGRGLLGKGGPQAPPSAAHEIIQILREQAAWSQGPRATRGGVHLGNAGFRDASSLERAQLSAGFVGGFEHTEVFPGAKRAYGALGEDASFADSRGYPRARVESSIPAGIPSYGWATREQGPLPNALFGESPQQRFYHHSGVAAAVGHLHPTSSAGSAASGSTKGSGLLHRPSAAHGARRGRGSGSSIKN